MEQVYPKGLETMGKIYGGVGKKMRGKRTGTDEVL